MNYEECEKFIDMYMAIADSDDRVLEAIKVLALIEIAKNTEYIG